MNKATHSWRRRALFSMFILAGLFILAVYWSYKTESSSTHRFSDRDLAIRLYALPTFGAGLTFVLSTLLAAKQSKATTSVSSAAIQKPFMAQVVGMQWLNPLQRRDYSTEWQLLWTLGLAAPNDDDDKVKSNPKKYSTVQTVADIAFGIDGTVPFDDYHFRYIRKLPSLFRDIYFSDSQYFYNAHSLKDKSTWRELAGIHVEYALPKGKLDPVEAAAATRDRIISSFDIGNKNFPKSWTRSTPPDVHITMGGPNAGFTSLKGGLDYLQAHPSETVWVMNWDAPSRPKDAQINENMVLLVLAGPNYKTDRAPLAWLPYPATARVNDFTARSHQPAPLQAWKATLEKAALNASLQTTDIGFVIHDANNANGDPSDRLAVLARTMAEDVPELDFMKQTFNTPALLGDMGAGTPLTNVALAIAYANHFGKNVLVAGTTDAGMPTATIVLPPPIVRPIIPGAPWFRARSGNHAYLPWWGLRHDAPPYPQGFSQ